MNEIVTAKVFEKEFQRRPILEELAKEDQRMNEQNDKPWIIRVIAEMNLNHVMRNILLWISISTMINYGETTFTDNHDSVGLLKIIFDKVTIIEWKAKDTEIMSEEKLLVITNTKRF